MRWRGPGESRPRVPSLDSRRRRPGEEEPTGLAAEVVDLTTHEVPQLRRHLPLVEKHRVRRTHEQFRCGVDQVPCTVIGVHPEHGRGDALRVGRLPARLRALQEDRARGLQTVSRLGVRNARPRSHSRQARSQESPTRTAPPRTVTRGADAPAVAPSRPRCSAPWADHQRCPIRSVETVQSARSSRPSGSTPSIVTGSRRSTIEGGTWRSK